MSISSVVELYLLYIHTLSSARPPYLISPVMHLRSPQAGFLQVIVHYISPLHKELLARGLTGPSTLGNTSQTGGLVGLECSSLGR